MTAPSYEHDRLVDRVVRAARIAGWRTRREVTGALWRADVGCYRDGACVLFEVQINAAADLPRRHYERMHTGAWCFWFIHHRGRRAYDIPVFTADQIEAQVQTILNGPVPLLPPGTTKIERPLATVDSAQIISCRVCTFSRRLIGCCWRCGFAGGPYHPTRPDEAVTATATDFANKVRRLKRIPVKDQFAEALAWRDSHYLAGPSRELNLLAQPRQGLHGASDE